MSKYEIILASRRAVKIPNNFKNIKVIQINWKDEESISNACKILMLLFTQLE